jgi:anti-sigma B factor antagonist
MEGFEVKTSSVDGVATVVLEGELDIATASVLDATLTDVERNGTGTMLLDLAGVRFIDSTGLRALLSARQRAETAGRTLRLTNIPADVERVFDVTGVRRIFDIASRA